PRSVHGHGFPTPEPPLLELAGGQISRRRVVPLAVVDVVQEPTELAVRIGEVPVLGQIDLLLSYGPHQPLGEAVLLPRADRRHAWSRRRGRPAGRCTPWRRPAPPGRSGGPRAGAPRASPASGPPG